MGILNIQKVPSGYFEYPWSDVMGILNVQKLDVGVNMKWHGYLEYSKADVMDILNIYEVMSLVFWIRSDMEFFRSWRHGYFEYS